jgi:hypothetical protein
LQVIISRNLTYLFCFPNKHGNIDTCINWLSLYLFLYLSNLCGINELHFRYDQIRPTQN